MPACARQVSGVPSVGRRGGLPLHLHSMRPGVPREGEAPAEPTLAPSSAVDAAGEVDIVDGALLRLCPWSPYHPDQGLPPEVGAIWHRRRGGPPCPPAPSRSAASRAWAGAGACPYTCIRCASPSHAAKASPPSPRETWRVVNSTQGHAGQHILRGYPCSLRTFRQMVNNGCTATRRSPAPTHHVLPGERPPPPPQRGQPTPPYTSRRSSRRAF